MLGRITSSSRKTHIITAEVRFQFTSKDLESCTLADTVRPDEPEDLARSRRRQTVELERVGGVAVGDLRVEIRGQVDDGDGFERASGSTVSWGFLLGYGNVLFHADTTTYAQELRDEGDLVGRLDLDAELAYASSAQY